MGFLRNARSAWAERCSRIDSAYTLGQSSANAAIEFLTCRDPTQRAYLESTVQQGIPSGFTLSQCLAYAQGFRYRFQIMTGYAD